MITPATLGQPWQNHPIHYRTKEMTQLLHWVAAGASGAVIGLPGVGRSNLLSFLCHRPDAIPHYLPNLQQPLAFVLLDFNNLPVNTLATFYRLLLRSFYENCTVLSYPLQAQISHAYHTHLATHDPLIVQNALRDLLFCFATDHYRVVLVMDRFDAFCRMITPEIGNALSGLRDSFRDTLAFIVGVRQNLGALDALALAPDLQRLLASHLCYVGPLNSADARHLIAHRSSPQSAPSEDEVAAMLALSGGYPTLLKAISRWWLFTADRPPLSEWCAALLAEPSMQKRLQALWLALSETEQRLLSEMQKGIDPQKSNALRQDSAASSALQLLIAKGLCIQQAAGWDLFGTLFAEYIVLVRQQSRGKICWDQASQTIWQGQQAITHLTPKEERVLAFLLTHPKVRHTYTELIANVWSAEESYNGVTNDSLFQVIRLLRQKIEPNPADPIYIVNWRAKPEGGYLFFPEG